MKPPFDDNPRYRGVVEHSERATMLARFADAATNSADTYRLLLTAIYSVRAVVEIMAEAARMQELARFKNQNPDISGVALKTYLAGKLPYYQLVERIRIHDFHRFGILPPDPAFEMVFAGGPIKATARRGSASVVLQGGGFQVTTTGNSSVDLQRPLVIQDGLFLDDDSQQLVDLRTVVASNIKALDPVIQEFRDFLLERVP